MNAKTQTKIPVGASQNENSLLQRAKNYLEQELEVASGKKTQVVFGEYKGRQVFLNGTKIVGLVDNGVLKIFNDDAVLTGLPTVVDSVKLTAISAKDALYCKRCKLYLEKHPGLTRCSCHTYLKPRKRFFAQGENRIQDSEEIAEMAEIQFARLDAREAQKLETFKKRSKKVVLQQTTGYRSEAGMSSNWMQPRHQSMMAERIVSVKVDGKKVPEDCITAMVLGLAGPIEEESGNVWTIDESVEQRDEPITQDCLCGEAKENHDHGQSQNHFDIGGCSKTGCARFTVPRD